MLKKKEVISIEIVNFLLELIYPNVCGICGDINKESLCTECNEKIMKIETSRIEEYKNKKFENHAYLFKYEGNIRKLILDYKFHDKAYLYKTFARLILNNSKICKYICSYDLMIPVPIHKQRYIERGYNQSELIAKEISKKLINIEMEKKILIKIKNNLKQSTLNEIEREKNVKDVYKVINEQKIKDKKIILIDDIYTTGNTANECAKILKQSGAKKIGIFTLAKD